MTGYPIYLLGLLIVAAWVYLKPRLSLKALFWLCLLGLSLKTELLPNAVGMLLVILRLPVHTPFPLAGVLDESAWLGGIILLRALIGFTSWDRPKRLRDRFWAIGFILSLVLSPFFHLNERIFTLLLGPWLVSPKMSWLFALLPLPWLLSFRWKSKLVGLALFVAVATALISFVALVVNGTFTLGATWEGGHFHSFGNVRVEAGPALSPTADQGFLSLGWQAKEHFEIYALLFLPFLLSRIRPSVRRISVRMLGSHLLAGLVSAALIIVFLLISGALFLSTYRSTLAARYIERVSGDARLRLAHELVSTGRIPGFPFARDTAGQLILSKEGGNPAQVTGASFFGLSADSLFLVKEPPHAAPLLLIGPNLFVRARLDTVLGGRTQRVEALAPVDSLWMEEISRIIGSPVRLNPGLVAPEGTFKGDFSLGTGQGVSRGPIGPATKHKYELLGVSLVSCISWSGDAWRRASLPVYSYASFGETLLALFARAPAGHAFTFLPKEILWLVAVLLAGIAWWVGTVVFGMSNAIARAVKAMTQATEALGKGDLKHRIVIEGTDELWSVASSFNTMAEGLERMRQMELETERLERELEIARQVQQNLFPRELPKSERWGFAAICRPARAVGGDYYDVFALDTGKIAFAIGDVSGKGLGPSLLMSSVHTMIRTSLPEKSENLPRLMERLNEHLVSSTSPEMFMTLFIGVLNTTTGQLSYVNGGHCLPVVLSRRGQEPARLAKGGMAVGIMPGAQYDEGSVFLRDDSVLVLFSDGVTEAMNEKGEMFEEERLLEVLKGTGPLEASAILSQVLESVERFVGKTEQADDISVVVVSRRG